MKVKTKILSHLFTIGFILYFYDGTTHKPINHAPFHIFESSELCNNDLEIWKILAPEWLGICKENKN